MNYSIHAYNADQALLTGYKTRELNSLNADNSYELKNQQIKINFKYDLISDVLKANLADGIDLSSGYSVRKLVANFDAIIAAIS